MHHSNAWLEFGVHKEGPRVDSKNGPTRPRLDSKHNTKTIYTKAVASWLLVCGEGCAQRRLSALSAKCQGARASARISSEHLGRTNTSTLPPDTTTTIVKALAPVARDPPSANSISVVKIQKRRSSTKCAHSAIPAAAARAVTLPAWTAVAVTADRQPARHHRLPHALPCLALPCAPPVPYSR